MKYRNKIIILFLLNSLFLMTLCACAKDVNVSDTQGDIVSETESPAVNFLEVDYLGTDWYEIGFTVDSRKEEIVVNNSLETFDDAVLIGKDIAEQCRNNSSSIVYELTTVVHATEDGLWRFDYIKKQYRKGTKEIINKHGFHVVMDDDCNIIRVWVEEW